MGPYPPGRVTHASSADSAAARAAPNPRPMIDSRPSRLVAGLVAGVGCIALAFQSIAATSVQPAPVSQEAAEQEPEAEEEHGPLHESMEILQGGMRSMRVVSLTCPASRGTLRSTRTKTVRPLTSRSSTKRMAIPVTWR